MGLSKVLALFILMSGVLTNAASAQSNASQQTPANNFPRTLSDKKMRFSLFEVKFDPNKGRRRDADDIVMTGLPDRELPESVWIRADGYITPRTPTDFEAFLLELCESRQICEPGDRGVHTIGLNSNGGNLLAGIELGKMIRSRGYRTALVRSPDSGEGRSMDVRTGACLSACSYAFLGGIHRRLEVDYAAPDDRIRDMNERGLPRRRSSVFGVHRFRRDGSALAQDLAAGEVFVPSGLGSTCEGSDPIEVTQCVDAQLLSYITDMGVDPSFFVAAASQSSDQIRFLRVSELRAMRVLNEQAFVEWRRGIETGEPYSLRLSPPWAIASENSDQAATINRISFFCTPEGQRRISLSTDRRGIFLETGQNEIETWVLFIDRKLVTFGPDKLRYVGFNGAGTLYLKLESNEWNEHFSSAPVTISAFKVREIDMPLSQRTRVDAVLDTGAMREIQFVFENRCGSAEDQSL